MQRCVQEIGMYLFHNTLYLRLTVTVQSKFQLQSIDARVERDSRIFPQCLCDNALEIRYRMLRFFIDSSLHVRDFKPDTSSVVLKSFVV